MTSLADRYKDAYARLDPDTNLYPHGDRPGSRGRVYVASSWRNDYQEVVVHILRAAGFEVYDFKNPPRATGFHWSEVNVASDGCSLEDFEKGLAQPRSQEGFRSDYEAMLGADYLVLVLPCGKSAHLELGWATGQERIKTIVLFEAGKEVQPELMYLLADHLVGSMHEMLGVMGVED